MEKIRVLIVDDHAILRMGLASLLGTRREFEVVGDAGNADAALRKVQRLKPDVVVMDLAMPGKDGVEATRAIRKERPGTNVLILTTFGTSDGISRALNAGASGAIMKNAPFQELVAAIKAAADGKRCVSAEIERILADDPPVQELSPRQTQILELMVRGLSNLDIATSLSISVDMVKEHAIALFAKMGVANRTEAVAMALRKRLLKI